RQGNLSDETFRTPKALNKLLKKKQKEVVSAFAQRHTLEGQPGNSVVERQDLP
ncbi:16158_t:CDS:2, partial [Gigaspora margarita]